MNENSNNGKEPIIFCSRCGSEMKASARYCMKCGNLNYNHPSNESMKPYIQNNVSVVNNTYVRAISGGDEERQIYKNCFIFNLLVWCSLPLIIALISRLDMISLITVVLVFGGTMFLYMYSFQCIIIKAGEPWWSVFIPFYSNYVYYKIIFDNGWLFLTLYIPIVGEIILLISFYKLGKMFSRSGWLTLFFPLVMIPIIGLSKNTYLSLSGKRLSFVDKIDESGKTKSEKIYRRNRIMITLIVFVGLCILLYFFWPFVKIIINKIIEMFEESIEFFR